MPGQRRTVVSENDVRHALVLDGGERHALAPIPTFISDEVDFRAFDGHSS